EHISVGYLLASLAAWLVLYLLNRAGRLMHLTPYLLGGALLWFFMLQSGIHATVAGVLLAFAVPFTAKREDCSSPSYRLEHRLHRPVAFLILPIFALANTAIPVHGDWLQNVTSWNSFGIAVGLIAGKPLGVMA